MSDFKAKRTKFDFGWSSPRPRWGAFSAPPEPIAGFKWPSSFKRMGGEGEWEVRGVVRGGKGRKGREDGLQHWTPSGRPNPATPLILKTWPCFTTCVTVRLSGGSRVGRLEVFNYGVWGTVCDNTFDDADARVACSTLGFGYVTDFSIIPIIQFHLMLCFPPCNWVYITHRCQTNDKTQKLCSLSSPSWRAFFSVSSRFKLTSASTRYAKNFMCNAASDYFRNHANPRFLYGWVDVHDYWTITTRLTLHCSSNTQFSVKFGCQKSIKLCGVCWGIFSTPKWELDCLSHLVAYVGL